MIKFLLKKNVPENKTKSFTKAAIYRVESSTRRAVRYSTPPDTKPHMQRRRNIAKRSKTNSEIRGCGNQDRLHNREQSERSWLRHLDEWICRNGRPHAAAHLWRLRCLLALMLAARLAGYRLRTTLAAASHVRGVRLCRRYALCAAAVMANQATRRGG